jgi:diacylglycerol kinase family enzyme
VKCVITVFLNPNSGVHPPEDRPALLARLFEAAGAAVGCVILGAGVDTGAAVRAAVAEGSTTIVAAGGDGTVNSVASALVGSSTPLGVLPMGTLNHFARDVGIPFDLPRAVATIVAAHTTRVDVGAVNAQVFLNNSSIGVYPDIVVERERLRTRGHRRWTALAIAIMRVVRHYRGLFVRIESDHVRERARTPFLFVGNNEYEIEGLHIGARARLDCGTLVAYLAPRTRARDLPKMVALALVGRVRKTHTLASFPAKELQVNTPRRRRLRVAFDGEVTVMTPPLLYRTNPLALTVIVPAR